MLHCAQAREGDASSDAQKSFQLTSAIDAKSSNINEPSFEAATESEASGESTNSRTNENGSIEQKTETLDRDIVDAMMGSKRSTGAPASKSMANKIWGKREDYFNIFLMIFMIAMVFGNFYFVLAYNRDAGCEPGEGAINVAIFCLVAGSISFVILMIGFVMWRKGQNSDASIATNSKKRDGDVEVGKTVCCLTFWNLVLAFIGVWMYCFQFDFACKMEPIAIFILIWSLSQFIIAFWGCSACCYLLCSHIITGSHSRCAEDVAGAGFAFQA